MLIRKTLGKAYPFQSDLFESNYLDVGDQIPMEFEVRVRALWRGIGFALYYVW